MDRSAKRGTDKACVLLIATLDTKGEEALYVREILRSEGCEVVLMDPGILQHPRIQPDISREQVAEAGGESLFSLLESKDKGLCIRTMMRGASVWAERLFREGKIQGVISIGGAQGTDIGTAAMRALPFGVPKFMVSTVASGQTPFGPFVGTKDIILMHSVADIQGLNRLTCTVLRNAAVAVSRMVLDRWEKGIGRKQGFEYVLPKREGTDKGAVALSMLGTTTQGALLAKERLEREGFEVVAFHQNGTGGIAMEDLIRECMFRGVLDLNLHEIGDRVAGGLHGAIRDYRLESAGQLGIPQVVAPGSINYTVQGPLETLSPEMKKRKYIVHNPNLTLVRLSRKELEITGKLVAEKLNRAKGPVCLFLPLKGLSYPDREGLPHWDPEDNQFLFDTIKQHLNPQIPVRELDAHINDPEFIHPVVDQFLQILDIMISTK
ncbi:MAG: Tm-1-like ATP-binding domain-containing protein [Spirochaetes bacterium]|nr:Tm-1-like ATP-binding domain-containing protein [Spirochaetota bacterium]